MVSQGAAIDTTAVSKLVFGVLCRTAEFERELIPERACDELAAVRVRGRTGGCKPVMAPAKIHLASAAMGKRGMIVGDQCEEQGITCKL